MIIYISIYPTMLFSFDREWLLTHISRVRHYSTLNIISETIQERHYDYYRPLIECGLLNCDPMILIHVRSKEGWHCPLPWMTSENHLGINSFIISQKYSMYNVQSQLQRPNVISAVVINYKMLIVTCF